MLVASAPKARLHLADLPLKPDCPAVRVRHPKIAVLTQLKLKQMTMKMAQSDPIWSK